MRRLRNERGAAVVEFALVMPVVFLAIVGGLTVLWMLAARSTLTGVARDAARFASIPHDPLACTAEPCPEGYPTAAEVEAFVEERVGDFGVDEVILVRPTQPNEPVTVTVRRELPRIVDAVASVFGADALVYESAAKVRAE